MKVSQSVQKAIIAMIFLLLLIIDTVMVSEAAKDGIDLCIKVIIPSLFPFFILTTYLCDVTAGMKFPGLAKIFKNLKIPSGAETILLLGFLGGYPVGAQLIANAYHSKVIDQRTANCLMGYCNNAGPAFIFGIIAPQFSSIWIGVILWLIHILSALFTGWLLPKPLETTASAHNTQPASVPTALEKSIRICSYVCGWIIVFKIIASYTQKLFAPMFSGYIMIIITGLLEISNGCLQLGMLQSTSLRFILCSVFLALGGGCVTLQTVSASKNVGLGNYIPGKLLQAGFSLVLSILFSIFLFQ